MYVARQGSVMMAVKLKLCQITGGKGGRYYNILQYTTYVHSAQGRKEGEKEHIYQTGPERNEHGTKTAPAPFCFELCMCVHTILHFPLPPLGAGKKYIKATIPQSWEPVQYCIHTMQEVRGAHILRKDET